MCAELEPAEDSSDHNMNNRDTEDVLKEYGQEWIIQRMHFVNQISNKDWNL